MVLLPLDQEGEIVKVKPYNPVCGQWYDVKVTKANLIFNKVGDIEDVKESHIVAEKPMTKNK